MKSLKTVLSTLAAVLSSAAIAFAIGGWGSNGVSNNLVAKLGSTTMVRITENGLRIGDNTAPTENLEVATNATIGGTLAVTGASTLTGATTFSGATTQTGILTLSAGVGALTFTDTAASILLKDADVSALDIGSAGATDLLAFVTSNGTESVTVNGELTVAAGEAFASDALKITKVTLSNAEIKDLVANPKTLVAAPGAGKVVIVESVTLALNAGTEALTESADNLVVQYSDGLDATGAIESTGFIDQAADTGAHYKGIALAAFAEASVAVNKAVELLNTDGDFAGNATADATLDVWVAHRIITL